MGAMGEPASATRLRAVRRGFVAVVVASLAVLTIGFGEARADETFEFDRAGNAPQISLIGDSTLAGVRWYFDYGDLQRFNFVLNAESCRRTIELSCFSREGYRSANVLAVMQSLDGRLGDVLVIMSGYNDPTSTIDEAIDGVIEEAQRQGVDNVVWLTLRTASNVAYSDPQQQTSVATFEEYNDQLFAAAEASDGYLQVADWATYSNGAGSWFETDGVHLTSAGVDAVTTFIAGSVERVLAGEDISPASGPWTTLVPGAEGEVVTAVQQAVIDAGVDLPGGVDGVFGNETMFAVAEYQRRAGDLQVTGAVDVATARALGVFDVDDEAVVVAPEAALPETRADSPTEPAAAVAEQAGTSGGGSGRLPIVLGLIAVALVVVVFAAGRRRRQPPARHRRHAEQSV